MEILMNADALSKNYGEIPCVTKFKRLATESFTIIQSLLVERRWVLFYLSSYVCRHLCIYVCMYFFAQDMYYFTLFKN